jgi:hypothetical protein
MKKAGLHVLLLVALLSPPAWGQEEFDAVRPEPLRGDIVKTVSIPLQGEPGFWPMALSKCDADGSVYVPQYVSDNPGLGPIAKFSPSGDLKAKFTLDAPELAEIKRKGGTRAYFVSTSGDLYQIGQIGGTYDIFVIHWDRDGTFRKKTRLDARFDPSGNLVVFPSGEMLVSGFAAHDSGEHQNTPLNLLFDQSGRVIKEFRLEEENDAPESSATAREKQEFMASVHLGEAALGADGNLYMIRRRSPAVVYVISSQGQVLRKLALAPDDLGRPAARLAEHEGRLAVLLYQIDQPETTMVVMDSYGHEIARYDVERGVGRVFACMDKDHFTFVGFEGKEFVLKRAKPL